MRLCDRCKYYTTSLTCRLCLSQTDLILSTKSIKIGTYTLSIDDKNDLWIVMDSGEGGQFKANDFHNVVKDFYNKNF